MTADPTIAKMDVPAGKPGPSVQTIITAAQILVEYGHFKWGESDGFEIGKHESIRFEHWLDQATRAGQLTISDDHELGQTSGPATDDEELA